MNVKAPVVHVRLRVHGNLDYRNTKITKHKLKLVKMSVRLRVFSILKLGAMRKTGR